LSFDAFRLTSNFDFVGDPREQIRRQRQRQWSPADIDKYHLFAWDQANSRPGQQHLGSAFWVAARMACLRFPFFWPAIYWQMPGPSFNCHRRPSTPSPTDFIGSNSIYIILVWAWRETTKFSWLNRGSATGNRTRSPIL